MVGEKMEKENKYPTTGELWDMIRKQGGDILQMKKEICELREKIGALKYGSQEQFEKII